MDKSTFLVAVHQQQFQNAQPLASPTLFRRYCTVCHSPTRVNPDLHRSQVPLSKDQFKAVVYDGVLRDGGMSSFANTWT